MMSALRVSAADQQEMECKQGFMVPLIQVK